MDSALHDILIHTYNADPLLRKQAETALDQFVITDGALFVLLSFVGNQCIHRDLRQAAGIIIKNKICQLWREVAGDINDPEQRVYLQPTDKHQARAMILDVLLVETDNSIRGLLAEAIKSVAEVDFPAKWPELLPTLLTHVQSSDNVLKMYNALVALRKVVKRYEYKMKEQRGPMNEIVQTAFPVLQRLMVQILDHPQLEAAQVMHQCLKIFWSATMYSLPEVTGIDVNGWFQMIGTIMQKALPEASEGLDPQGQPILPEERKAWPWWKLKKWALRIVSHFIQRYGNPRYAATENEKFAEYFKNTIAGPLLGPVMNCLAIKAQGNYITDDVHRLALTYLASSVEMSITYKVIKPHIDFLLLQVIFPTLCLTSEEARLFSDDPVEFIRKVHDPMEDFTDPRLAATNLLQVLARYRQKDTLPRLLPFLQGVLTEYNNTLPVEARNFQRKDGVLVSLAVLFKILADSKVYRPMLEPLIVTHVLPEFQSPVAFMRSRACWVIEYFGDMTWKDKNTLPAILQGLLGGLRDPALPVQAAAACSLRTLISQEGATDLLRPYLKDIVGEYFRIMEEAENDAVLGALQAIVDQYGEEIRDLAPDMVAALLKAFHGYANAGSEDDEAAFSACQCLDTIIAILDAVQKHPTTMLALELVLLPLLQQLLGPAGSECFEYLDNAIEMLNYFTFANDALSPAMWSMCGPLLVVMDDWGYDYMPELMVPVLNYITKDVTTFLVGFHSTNGEERVTLVDLLLRAVDKAFKDDSNHVDRETRAAATLLASLFTCAKQASIQRPEGGPPGTSLDGLVAPVMAMINARLSRCCQPSAADADPDSILTENRVKLKVLECGLGCLYYNPGLVLQAFAADPVGGMAACNGFFGTLFTSLLTMDDDLTQRLIVMAISELMMLPSSCLPSAVRENQQAMFMQCIRELVMIEEEKEKADNAEDEDEEDDDDGMIDDDDDDDDDADDDDDDIKGDSRTVKPSRGLVATSRSPDGSSATYKRLAGLAVPEGGYDEEEDCLNTEDEEYRQMLEEMEKKDTVKSTRYVNGEAVDAVDDEDDDREDFLYTSPLGTYDVTKRFLEVMTAVGAREPQLAEGLRNGLNAEDNQRLAQLIAKVTERQQQLQLQP